LEHGVYMCFADCIVYSGSVDKSRSACWSAAPSHFMCTDSPPHESSSIQTSSSTLSHLEPSGLRNTKSSLGFASSCPLGIMALVLVFLTFTVQTFAC